jgi:hypothetical protein
MLLRNIRADIPITEAHPKALLWLIGIAHRERSPDKISLAHQVPEPFPAASAQLHGSKPHPARGVCTGSAIRLAR